MAIPIAVTQPGMETETDLYELGQVIEVVDRHRRDMSVHGDRVVIALDDDPVYVEGVLDMIDEDWHTRFEILHLSPWRIDELLHR